MYLKNSFWHIQNHLQQFGKIQNHYRNIFKKLCIHNNVLYTAELSPVWKTSQIRELFREHMICKHKKLEFYVPVNVGSQEIVGGIKKTHGNSILKKKKYLGLTLVGQDFYLVGQVLIA